MTITDSQFATVLVLRDLPSYYTYTIPDTCEPGDHVVISFGTTQALGLIINRIKKPRVRYAIKPVVSKWTALPRLPMPLLTLMTWFATYYLVTPYVSYMTIIGKRHWVDLPADCDPNPSRPKQMPDHVLTHQQQRALDALMSGPQEQLLFGITGSGKTELYVHIARHYLAKNQSVFVLLPEINLTPQIKTYFESRFANRVITLHSGLTPKQRNQAWCYAYTHTPCIVIGPRSAIFSPVHNLGLIIIDESHDQSYKQDNTPLYHVHTVARKLGDLHQAKLIHGTATPDIDLYYRLNKTQAIVRLDERLHARSLPKFTGIDTTQDDSPALIKPYLHSRLQDTLDQGNKSIILLNRRGYAPLVMCRYCLKTHACEGCGLSYTYHHDQSLRCHRCLVQTPLTHQCTHCRKNGLQAKGLGIQKLVLMMHDLFPTAKIMRLDRDTAATLKQQTRLLSDFRDSGDILIGTQMIAKGHHIDTVTLVGILGIETVLNSPHFRCAEHAFQLITQVAGRAGRGTLTGEVIIQTNQPDHYAIETAMAYDYQALYQQECDSRQLLNYPPFCRLIRLVVYSESATRALTHLRACHSYLAASGHHTVTLSDPIPAPLEKHQNYYRFHMLIKVPHDDSDAYHDTLKSLPKYPKTVRRLIDLDPVTIV